MTLTRLALAGLLVMGSLVFAAFLLASVSEEVHQVSSGLPADEPMASPALADPPALSMVTCVLPASSDGVFGLAAPLDHRCLEGLQTHGVFRTKRLTEC